MVVNDVLFVTVSVEKEKYGKYYTCVAFSPDYSRKDNEVMFAIGCAVMDPSIVRFCAVNVGRSCLVVIQIHSVMSACSLSLLDRIQAYSSEDISILDCV